ncbi:MAG: hypothetical protein WA705_07080 [Candidatus Ozemobacteraceae bacterium]
MSNSIGFFSQKIVDWGISFSSAFSETQSGKSGTTTNTATAANTTAAASTTIAAAFAGSSIRISGTENDQIQVSAFSAFRGAIDTFRRKGSDGGMLDIQLSGDQKSDLFGLLDPSAETEPTTAGTSRMEREFDLMLRMIATDDEDYQRLRTQFRDLFAIANKGTMGSGQQANSAQGQIFQAENQATDQSTVASQAGSQATSSAIQRPVGVEAQARYAEVAMQTEATRSSLISTTSSTTNSTTNSAANSSGSLGKAQMTFSFERVNGRLEIREIRIPEAVPIQVAKVDPLALDTNGDGLHLTTTDKGAWFDMNADGRPEKVGWVQGDDGLLMLDRNGNGTIDNGTEVFGEQNGAAHGFAELAKFDGNRDGVIDSKDKIYKALKLYRDMNSNGRIEKNELVGLQEAGISSLNLSFQRVNQQLGEHILALKGSFTHTDGRTGELSDVLLAYKDASSAS